MSANLCEHCTAVCCRYVALPIDEPTTRGEFDDVRWYLLHENVSVFVEDGEWYISFATPCRHLQPDHRCGIYQTRPSICRKYTTDNCDYHSGDYGWEHHFTCPEHLDEYVTNYFAEEEANGAANGRRRRKKAKSTGKTGGRRVRPRLKARPRPLRADEAIARATTDIAGVPLPVLGAVR